MMEAELLGYLQYMRVRAAATTYQRKQWQIGSFLKHLAAKRKYVAHVKQSDVEEYLQAMKVIQQTKQAICAVVREFYDYLKRYHPEICPEKNPAAEIAFKPDSSVRLFKVPSQETIDEIFDRLSDAKDELPLRNRLLAELAYGSGLRRSELARLNIEDIDLEGGSLRVLGKGDKPRIVPLTSQAMETIRKYITLRHGIRGPLFVSSSGRRLCSGTVWLIFRENAGMRPHLMRHACATHMLKNGCNLRYIQELLGHSRLSTTYVYTAVEKSTLREVVSLNHPRSKDP